MDYCGGGATVPLMFKVTSDLRSPALVEAVLEQLPDAVIVYDLERKIVFSNGAADNYLAWVKACSRSTIATVCSGVRSAR